MAKDSKAAESAGKKRVGLEKHLAYLNRISNVFLVVPDDQMYWEVLDVVLEITGSRFGLFGYIREDGALVIPSMTKEIYDLCQAQDKTMIFPMEKWGGLWGEALISKKTRFKNGSHKTPEGHIKIERSVAVPLIHSNELVGILTVANKNSDYVREDIELLESLADYISPVLHARLQRDRLESDRNATEKALRLANEKLNILSSLTRHDILNQLTVLIGSSQLAMESHCDEKGRNYLEKAVDAANNIQRQLEFSRDYQNIGVKKPEWQNLKVTAIKGISLLDHDRIEIAADLGEYEVFADHMLEKVFHNLLDNSLRHAGKKQLKISIRAKQAKEGLVVVFEDDGIGIPAGEKEKIFEKGFGRNTGLGLYLVRQILEMTEISIRETGTLGKGARFEMAFPEERFRKTHPDRKK